MKDYVGELTCKVIIMGAMPKKKRNDIVEIHDRMREANKKSEIKLIKECFDNSFKVGEQHGYDFFNRIL